MKKAMPQLTVYMYKLLQLICYLYMYRFGSLPSRVHVFVFIFYAQKTGLTCKTKIEKANFQSHLRIYS